MDETTLAVTAWSDPILEAELLEAISLEAPWAAVERFATLVRSSGSAEERQAYDYLIEHLREWGVPHTLHEPLCFISIPLEATLRVDAPDGQRFGAKTDRRA
jgi:hypothetical protein